MAERLEEVVFDQPMAHTAALVAAHRGRITLSPINSGATFTLGPAPRGPTTFQPIEGYNYVGRPSGERVVELAVDHAVPDIAALTRRVVRMRADTEIAILFDRGP